MSHVGIGSVTKQAGSGLIRRGRVSKQVSGRLIRCGRVSKEARRRLRSRCGSIAEQTASGSRLVRRGSRVGVPKQTPSCRRLIRCGITEHTAACSRLLRIPEEATACGRLGRHISKQ